MFVYTELIRLLSPHKVRLQEPLKNHTTFRIGGPADCMVFPESAADLAVILDYGRKHGMSVFFFGLGSNLLVGDRGIRGISIKVGERLKGITVSGNMLEAYAGTSLASCAKTAARNALGGMEFAEGIPGSIAGAVVMNAGAYGGEMKDIVSEVTVINAAGQLHTYEKEDLEFSYRHSRFTGSKDLIIKVKLQLYEAEEQKVWQQMKTFAEQRRAKQPLEYPSAGSAFKRPEGRFVGPLLEEMGLKGYQIGGAQVSTKHAGFIINKGDATAWDVRRLINFIQTKVLEEYGIILEPEIKMVGEF